MGFITFTTVFCLCLSASFATYGPDYGPKSGPGPRPQLDGPKIKLDEPRIHLDSPKIVLDRPSINLGGGGGGGGHGELLEEEPLYLSNEKNFFFGKALHGIPAGLPAYSSPLIVDSGYSSGKVLDISAPIQVINHAPIVHERPILIRRPVVVSKGLTTTQDHLEKLHYSHSGLELSGLGHSALVGHSVGAYSLPLAKGLHGGTVLYGGGGLSHGLGAYSAPLIVDQPKAIYGGHADVGYASGKILGGPILAGPVLHGGSLHGGALYGGALNGGALHGGASLKKY